MRRTPLLLLALPVVLLAGCSGDTDLPDTARASELVAAVYAEQAGGDLLQDASRDEQSQVLTSELVDLLETGMLDVDPLYGAQDLEVSDVEQGEATLDGETAVVPVSFTNLGEEQESVVRLEAEGDDWRISDVALPDGRSLLEVLRG